MERLSYLAFLILGLAGTVPGMALPFFIVKFDLSFSQAGLLFSAGFLGFLIAASFFPVFAKRLTLKTLLGLAFFVLALSFVLIPRLPVWFLAVGAGWAAGLGMGTGDAGFNTLVAGLRPQRSGAALNWLHFFYGLGAFLGPTLLSCLLNWGAPWPTLYESTGLLALTFGFLWLGSAKIPPFPSSFVPSPVASSAILSRPGFWILVGTIFSYVACEVGLLSWVPTFLTTKQTDPAQAALGISVIWIGITLGRAVCALLVTKLRPKTLLLLLTGGSTLTLIFLIFAKPLHSVFAVLFLIGIFFSGIFPLIIQQGSSLYPAFPAQITGSLITAASLGGLLGPGFLGLVGEYYSLETGFILLACLMFLSALLLAFLPAKQS